MSTTLLRARRGLERVSAVLLLTTLATLAWMRGETVRDDRGSDSSEKSLMIILGITIGGVVTAAAGTYIATKTKLFK
ncbi:hypothetical protein M6B22_06970 [Jatrophihabitans cynanchi]|uniref:Uncharacterized protein n=1 Tax=Jatrophihabitans cynanchi TaxID=2944128 RepID=A0ABY7K3L3_9ACTN|nr:hypothetical protein [Jatrophihabitans sp. SB3-54]WAX58498.1 hypothetical protein M6B22_06970 [Jatrophihabitans sp. SB3-54]